MVWEALGKESRRETAINLAHYKRIPIAAVDCAAAMRLKKRPSKY